MAMNNDNDLEELDFGEGQPNPDSGEKKPGNKTFLIALAVLGGILVIAVLSLLAVMFLVVPGRTADQNRQRAQQLAANTVTAQAATVVAQKALILLTPSVTPSPTPTKALPTTTNTPVIAPAATKVQTATSTGVPDAQKATLSAQQTQLASGKYTTTVIVTSTALPTTGFADEVGLPGLLGVGAALILVIFLARRIRTH